MSTPPVSLESDRLLAFCRKVAERREHWPPGEELLAEEFVSFFGISAFAHFGTLTQFCGQLGISVSVRPMPSELRGHNASYNGTRTIAVAEHESFPGTKEHTLLHELRELLEHSFLQIGSAVATTPEDLEKRAEQFACLVRSKFAQSTILVWLDQAQQVEKKWFRYGAYILTVLGGLAMLLGCLFLPAFEDQALEHRRQSARQSSR